MNPVISYDVYSAQMPSVIFRSELSHLYKVYRAYVCRMYSNSVVSHFTSREFRCNVHSGKDNYGKIS